MWPNFCPHTWHIWGFSPVCTTWCKFICFSVLKVLSQRLHFHGFSFRWTVRWLVRLPECEKCFPHVSQLYGFSPVWILWCASKLPFTVKPCPHTEQRNGFTSRWTRSCILTLANVFPHVLQSPFFSVELWRSRCFSNPFKNLNFLPHCSQLWGPFKCPHLCWFSECLQRKFFPHSLQSNDTVFLVFSGFVLICSACGFTSGCWSSTEAMVLYSTAKH